ncbi:MAG: hypothetical protein GY874_23055 [Desulfobacteraceae bacterium]|nr:hypothetical protein [Desulfobacteraceae bacterium]
MRFCTAINCMDGRVQLPVNHFLTKRFNADCVDTITEPGPNLILSERNDPQSVVSIIKRLEISINGHNSAGIAIVGHYDCAGNSAEYGQQIKQLEKAVDFLRGKFASMEIIGLWVDENWTVHEAVTN